MKRRANGGHVATVAVLAFLAVTPVGEAPGRFSDEDGNVHEDNIEALASLGITRECKPRSTIASAPTTQHPGQWRRSSAGH